MPDEISDLVRVAAELGREKFGDMGADLHPLDCMLVFMERYKPMACGDAQKIAQLESLEGNPDFLAAIEDCLLEG